MDGSILLGIMGIVASVGVGLGTFSVADRRSRRHRYLSARNLIIHELTKSLSEDNVPPYQIIQFTIRSVLRKQGHADLTVISVEEIVEDLTRQITGDSFLDSERRARLQGEILKSNTPPPRDKPVRSDESVVEDIQQVVEQPHAGSTQTLARFASVLAGVTSSIAAALMLSRIPVAEMIKGFGASAPNFPVVLGTVSGLITVLVTVLWTMKKKG